MTGGYSVAAAGSGSIVLGFVGALLALLPQSDSFLFLNSASPDQPLRIILALGKFRDFCRSSSCIPLRTQLQSPAAAAAADWGPVNEGCFLAQAADACHLHLRERVRGPPAPIPRCEVCSFLGLFSSSLPRSCRASHTLTGLPGERTSTSAQSALRSSSRP